MKKLLYIIVAFTVFFSCKQEKQKIKEDKLLNKATSTGLKVTTTLINNTSFNKQLVANGIIEATQKSELRFKINEQLVSISVKNGQQVVKGQELARLENKLLANQLEKTNIDLSKALNKLAEEKINYGVSKTVNKDINPTILKSLQIKSGYFEAKNELEKAQLHYNQTILKAPFNGVVANINVKEGYYASASEVFCTIINPKNLEVVFSVLENELSFLTKGQKVTVQSFANSNKKYNGVITEINPLVDKNGLIQIKASIKTNNHQQLFDGMHVKVFVNKPIDNVIVIPKEALVLRSNKDVVFTLKNGLAKWNYVTKLYENSTEYAIKKGENLKVTDTIIISGNMNLSHDAKVHATFINKTTPNN